MVGQVGQQLPFQRIVCRKEEEIENRYRAVALPPYQGRRRQRIGVERLLVWTYQAQLAQFDGGLPQGASATSAVAGVIELGTTVQGSGAGVFATDPDAERVHGCVRRLKAAALLIGQARAGTRPEAKVGARMRWAPVLDDGRAVVERDRRGEVTFVHCRVLDRDEVVAFARGQYRAWHDGLLEVRRRLLAGPGLARFEITGELPPTSPWLDAVVVRRVLPALARG